MNKITDKDRLALVRQTLNYLLTETIEDVLIEDNLCELEGDYYTFFNSNFSERLMHNHLISENTKNGIDFLYGIIESIPSSDWNLSSFKENATWNHAQNVAKIILSQIGQSENVTN